MIDLNDLARRLSTALGGYGGGASTIRCDANTGFQDGGVIDVHGNSSIRYKLMIS
jgi:hypothetical protein